jgi:uncharacterized membrane protein YfcA
MTLEYWYVFPYAICVCIFATSSGFSGAVLFQPFFYFVLKIPVASSIATGIATETIGMSGAAYQYQKMKFHNYDVIKILLPWSIIGVIFGYYFFTKLPAPPLKGLVGLSMVGVSIVQFISLGWKSSNTNIQKLKRWSPVSLLAGAFSATTGTGVAELNQPLIEHIGKIPTKRANATAIFLEAISDILITILNLKFGNIRFDILVFSVSGVLIGSQIGPRLAPLLPDRILKIVFATGVGLIGIFYIWNYFKTLTIS